MKTDRKVDPASSSSTTTTTTTTSPAPPHPTNTTSRRHSNGTTKTTNSRKRKAANNDQPRKRSNFSDDEQTESITTEEHVVQGGRKQHHEKGPDGEEYLIAVSGRKKRVLVSPKPSSRPPPPPPRTAQQSKEQQVEQLDLDMNSDVDVVTVDEVVPVSVAPSRKSKKLLTAVVVPVVDNATASVPVPDPAESLAVVAPSSSSSPSKSSSKSSKRSNADTTTTTTSTTATATAKAGATISTAESSIAGGEEDKVSRNGTHADREQSTSTPLQTTKTTSKKTKAKSSRSKSTAAATTPVAPAKPAPAPVTAATPAVATTSTTAAATNSASSPPSTAATPGSETAPQKRVLPSRGGPSRGGMLRDKNTIPIEPSLLEPPPIPAGEYVLYLANEVTFQRTTLDPKRVPPATYGGTEDASPTESSTLADTRTQSTPLSAPPPPATTHIEVPIFKLCSINQFLQEEKKRRMQLLTKALAKAEAQAAAEAQALAHSDIAASATSRAVSTRQKHKAIVNSQQVSVQTAVPSFFSSSSTHVKKATTTNTTIGKIEGAGNVGGSGGVGAHAAQEEILSDEVYEKRHKKQEMVEKKLKNREKEKLRHAMYQQQLVVEKLKHMEVNRMMPISAFRSLQKTAELEQQLREAGAGLDGTSQQQSNAISLTAAKMMQEEYHRRLLQEAEDNLRRYEQLGLAESANIFSAPAYSSFSRTKNRLVTMTTHTDEQELAPAFGVPLDGKGKSIHSRSESSEGRQRKRPRTVDAHMEDVQDSVSPQRRRRKLSASSTSAIQSARKSQAKTTAAAVVEPPRPPKPITTFIKPGSILASGSRKSSRVALAFGEKVPILDRVEFDLPLDVFGAILRERFGDNEPALLTMRKSSFKKARSLQGDVAKSVLPTTATITTSTSTVPTNNNSQES
ncbi:hypothetical protein BGX29_006383 [Mortierella sp. GBA35]|nr:hypothetical protein BGX29_006383 [Mortierella sp. GBA35]